MTGAEYQKCALETLDPQLSNRDVIIMCGLGVGGESGEVVDPIKKYAFHGKELDIDHMEEEIGDNFWYLTNLASVLGLSVDNIMERNALKLRARHADKLKRYAYIRSGGKDGR